VLSKPPRIAELRRALAELSGANGSARQQEHTLELGS
jgi:hypothetical protein